MATSMVQDHEVSEFTGDEHYEVLHQLVSVLLAEGLTRARHAWAREESKQPRQTTLRSHIGTAEIKTALGANDMTTR
jgi:hypothetical protein